MTLTKTDLIHKIRTAFISAFKQSPLLSFAPGRINIIGEHTDYNDGFVFPAAIDKGICAAVQKSNTRHCRIVAFDVSDNLELDLSNLSPLKDGGWKNYVIGVIAEIKKMRPKLGNFNLVFGGNIPIGGGVSSSAALENSIGYVLNELFELGLTKLELIRISQRADHHYVGVKSGIMDHYTSMFGEANTALLLDCHSLQSVSYSIDLKDHRFLLVNTNVSHSLASSAYNKRRASCERVATQLDRTSLRDVTLNELYGIKSQLSSSDFDKARFVIMENDRTQNAAKAIENNDLDNLGQLLYQSHEGLQQLYQVSCDELDFLVDATRNNNFVLGARMMGGGFGGCTINLIRTNYISDFQAQIAPIYKSEFNKECDFYSVKLEGGTTMIT